MQDNAQNLLSDNYAAVQHCCVRELPLTVMFVDIKGFTTLAEQLPVAQVVNFLNQFYSHTNRIIETHHGQAFKFLGDGILAAFTHSDPRIEAQDARKAAAQILRQFDDEYGSVLDSYPALGVGIARGTVMLSALNTAGGPREVTLIGDPVNVASRLSDLAEGGQILCAEPFHQNLEGSQYRFIGDRVLKGKSIPVAVYRLTLPHEKVIF